MEFTQNFSAVFIRRTHKIKYLDKYTYNEHYFSSLSSVKKRPYFEKHKYLKTRLRSIFVFHMKYGRKITETAHKVMSKFHDAESCFRRMYFNFDTLSHFGVEGRFFPIQKMICFRVRFQTGI